MIATPNDYFLPYQTMIRAIIGKYLINSGYYDREDADDLFQEISEWLILKKEKIVGAFQGRAKFSSYLYTILYYKCIELERGKLRKKTNGPGFVNYSAGNLSYWLGNIGNDEISPEKKLILKEPCTILCKLLHDIIETYPKKKCKVTFCLRSIFRMLIYLIDLDFYEKEAEAAQKIKACTEHLNKNGANLTDQEIHAGLTFIFNLLENKTNKDDAIRKWIEDRQKEIIALLNGNSLNAHFDPDSFQLLFEYCFKNR